MERYAVNNFLMLSSREKVYVDKQIADLSIKCADRDQAVSQLSGGNKQKVVFGKWIGRGSEVLILDCPTRGVDIGVKRAMYQLMAELKKEGKSIIMISEEMPELLRHRDHQIYDLRRKEETTMEQEAILRKYKLRQRLIDLLPLAALAALFAILCITVQSKGYRLDMYLKIIFNEGVVLAVVATGAVFIYTLGSFDISLGAATGVSALLGAMAYNATGSLGHCRADHHHQRRRGRRHFDPLRAGQAPGQHGLQNRGTGHLLADLLLRL